MATTTLNFIEKDGTWQASYISSGLCVVELEREEGGVVSILANIQGMRAVPVMQHRNGYTSDAILKINVPSGIEVTIKSQTEVKNGKIMTS